jgi:hypothetical protein
VSYILDALKKAERDRRRAHVPSLAKMHSVPAERRTVWPWVVGGLVAVNAIGFAALFMLRPGTPPPTPTVAAPAGPAVAATPAPPAPAVVSTAPATPAAEPPVSPSPAVPRETPPASRPADARKTTEPAATTDLVRRTTTSREAAKTATARPVTVPATPTRVEPQELKLEVLVYSEEIAQRAAYINGQRYVEGQRVGGRMLVEEILRDGVVLTDKGRRFVLRQE